jgi:hypothetical protein
MIECSYGAMFCLGYLASLVVFFIIELVSGIRKERREKDIKLENKKDIYKRD